MELRSFSHLHYIQAIKGGSVTKVLNVYRGKPALKFMVVKDAYGTEDTGFSDPVPGFRSKVELVDFQVERDGTMDERHTLEGERETMKSEVESVDFPVECDGTMDGRHTPEEERQTVQSEAEALESSSKGSDSEARESDDAISVDMTLKQIKERCIKRKKKCSSYVGLSRKRETCFIGNQTHSSLQFEDEYDIMETLSCWKSRLLKKKKTKKKYSGNSILASAQNALSIVKFEDNPYNQVIFQSSENFPAPIAIEVEVPDLSYSDCKDMILVAVDSSFSCYEPLACIGMLPYEEPETTDDYDLETGISLVSSGELTTDACGFETQTQNIFSNEPQYFSVNEQSHEYMKHTDPQSIIGVQGSDEKIIVEGSEQEIGIEDNEDISHQFSGLSITPDVKEDSVVDQDPKFGSPETVSESFPCLHEKSHKTSSSRQIESSEVAVNNNLQDMQLSKRSGPCLLDDEAKGDKIHTEARVISSPTPESSSLWNLNLHSSSEASSVSVPDHSPTSEEKQSSLSVGAENARKCYLNVDSCIDGPVISARVEECPSKLQSPPERLLSTRMTISPASQKRLREALECTELDAEQYYKYARKLCYRKQTENKIGRTEGTNQIKKPEVSISPKKVIRKPKIDNYGCHQHDNASLSSRAAQSFSTGCTSIKSCSESAIVFSQQQMRDIESVTTKLAKELQSIRDIVEETLQSKFDPDTSKYNAEEIRVAMQKATRVEESAKRSLSIMARDCNRFCKIMKLAEKGSAAAPNAVRRKRKIVFADEAGGKLCDVKTFKTDTSSFTEPKGENTVNVD